MPCGLNGAVCSRTIIPERKSAPVSLPGLPGESVRFRCVNPLSTCYFGKKIDETSIAAGDYGLVIASDEDSYSSLPDYKKRTYNLNYWFSWYDNKDRVLQYYLFRDGKMGNMKIDVFVRNTTPAS